MAYVSFILYLFVARIVYAPVYIILPCDFWYFVAFVRWLRNIIRRCKRKKKRKKRADYLYQKTVLLLLACFGVIEMALIFHNWSASEYVLRVSTLHNWRVTYSKQILQEFEVDSQKHECRRDKNRLSYLQTRYARSIKKIVGWKCNLEFVLLMPFRIFIANSSWIKDKRELMKNLDLL